MAYGVQDFSVARAPEQVVDIHIEDLCRAVQFINANKGSGPFNFTAPNALRQKDFAKSLGRALQRPAFMPAPAFMVRLVMGELGTSLLQSQNALPDALNPTGFKFRYPTVRGALEQIYS